MTRFIFLIPVVVWLAGYVVFYCFGEFFSKKMGMNPGWQNFVLLLLSYNISVLFWVPSIIQKNSLSLTSTLYTLAASVAGIVLGLVVFHEKVTPLQGTGIALGIASMLMMWL